MKRNHLRKKIEVKRKKGRTNGRPRKLQGDEETTGIAVSLLR